MFFIECILNKSRALSPEAVIRALPRHFDYLNREYLITGKYEGFLWPNPTRDLRIPVLAPALETGGLSPEAWGALPYRENTAFLERKNQYSSRGIACRSKSEAGILQIYDEFRIPYHTDEHLIINGESLALDVTGARRDGCLIYHEHCGVNDSGYHMRSAHKLDLYERAGIVQGKNLLLTFDHDDSSIDLELIKMQIKDMYRL